MSNDVVMVVIPKELRDRWLFDLVEADTDAHKYSQEHGAGGYIENCQLCIDIADLRTAPETVSLDGVQRWDTEISYNHLGNPAIRYFKSDNGPDVAFSDLRRLVAPVQPSAAVTTEEPVGWVWSYLGDVHFSSTRPQWADDPLPSGAEAVEVRPVYASAPQPVASVQGGGDRSRDRITTEKPDPEQLWNKR